ncbi:MAG: hypothetical protein GXO79_00145 [Chlorobi bacterium]|nr:hypothetical protein [Chlorobiota bacterium]
MFHINPNSIKIIKAKRNFYKEMLNLLYVRIDNISKIKDIDNNIAKRLFDLHIISNLDDLLIGNPLRLYDLNQQILPFISMSKDFEIAVKYVFKYDNWFTVKTKERYNAYHLADNLGINTCVYCNRNYTNTIITREKRKISRAQFDHYFDKGENPLLALSFFNLIPSCSTCNSSIKHSSSFTLETHIHPYINNTISKVNFTYKYDIDSKDGLAILVSAKSCTKTEKTLEEFAIQEVYNVHTDLLYDMLKIRQSFSDRYLNILNFNLLKDIVVSKQELYRLAFGTELLEVDFIKRPFSKFKKDILKELGII